MLYVRAGAPAGGDGSAAAPFATIGAAMGPAASGTIIAVGKGSYDEAVQLEAGVTLFGACVAETVIASSVTSTTAGTINVAGAGTAVRNLTVAGARPGLWAVGGGRSVELRDVRFDRVTYVAALVAAGARATGGGVVIREPQPRADGKFGFALAIEEGGVVELDGLVADGCRDAAVFLDGAGSRATLARAAIRDTGPRTSDGAFGRGFQVQWDAELVLRGSVVARSWEFALQASGFGRVTLEDVVVAGPDGAPPAGMRGFGLALASGAEGTLARVAFVRTRELAIIVKGPDGSLTATDLVVRDTQPRASTGQFGRGLSVQEAGRAEVTRGAFAGNHDVGVFAAHQGSTVSLTDALVADTRSEVEDVVAGHGIEIQDGAQAQVERALVAGNREVGLLVAGGATVTGVDLVVRDQLPLEIDLTSGRGVEAHSGASLVLERATVEANRDVGLLLADPGTAAQLTDVAVRGTLAQDSDLYGGRGIVVQDGARAVATRLAVEENRDIGIFVGGAASVLAGADVVVRDTAERACAATTCAGAGSGVGVVAVGLGAADLGEFQVIRSALCGIQLVTGGVIDLRRGEIAENPIGVNVQNQDFDVARLADAVTFRDNTVNLDSAMLPVPEPSPSIGP